VSFTTEQLIALAKEAADLTNVADYVTDTTWLPWINAAVTELHRFVTNKFKATYYRTYDFTLAQGASQITLPSNFWRLKGLDINPDKPTRRTVRPFNFQERNSLKANVLRDVDPLIYAPDRFYNVIGSSLLKLQPQEQAAGSYRLYYVPKARTLRLVQAISIHGDSDNVVSGSSATWTFDSFDFTDTIVGDILTMAGDVVNPGNNGSRAITAIVSPIEVQTAGDGINTETFADPPVMTATIATVLEPELDPYAEYVWLTAAIKSLVKEESYQQAKALAEQRNLIRDDLTEALETDQGGPKTIIDTDDDGGCP
jgi:hypothetical protein